jgi:hypothetical protein
VLGRAQAGGSHYFPPVADPVVKEECGSCHIAFAPSMLPASSWKRMMDDLKNHFGDDATIDPAMAARLPITWPTTLPIAVAGATATSCCAACRPSVRRCASPTCRSG